MKLINPDITEETYCSKEKILDHRLEQYKTYVETVEKLTERRMVANTYFLTLNTVIVGIAGFSYQSLLNLNPKWVLLIPFLAVTCLCIGWKVLIVSYKQLSKAKYKVVEEFEKYLPTQPIATAEWEELGFGKSPKKYIPVTNIESFIPIIFGVIYGIGVLVIWLTGNPPPVVP